MLILKVPISEELYNEETNEFFSDVFELRLEHSLVSLSKWESKFCKPFLGKDKTVEETLWYVDAMMLDSKTPTDIALRLTNEHLAKVNEYIQAPMSATTIRETPNRRTNQETITAELIYYWMIALSIPFECQHWHLNRLLMLIRVCNAKNEPPKKVSKSEARARQRELNAQRRQAYGTRG